MSKMFFMPFRPAFDSAGSVVPGAQFYFTLTGTNTASAPYADAGLTTRLENPVIADGVGYLPPIYLDDAITYRVRVYLPDAEAGVDTPIEEFDPYVPAMVGSDIFADLRFWSDFGITADGIADDTIAVQAAFNWLSPGKILVMPGAKLKITSTVTLGNGSATALSTTANNCTIIWGGGSSNLNALTDTSDPWHSAAQSGTQFVWAGSSGGKMFELAGPIQGLRMIGDLVLNGGCVSNGGSGAGACLEAYSFSQCTIDGIIAVNWQASGRGILLSTVSSTGIGTIGNNSVLSGENKIIRLFASSPYGHNGECIRLDGYRVASGGDVTVSQFDIVQCGVSGTNAKGLCLGYIDEIKIGTLVNTCYGSISGSPAGVFLDSTTTPFAAPARVTIDMASVGQGLTVTGGTTAQVTIDEYDMDDGAVLPTATGLDIIRIRKTGSPINGLAYSASGVFTSRALADGEGFKGMDASGVHQHSLTRQSGGAAHVAGYGDVEFEAGATTGPTSAKQARVTTNGIDLSAGKFLSVGGTQVVATRDTGWTADTGTAEKIAHATYTPGSTLTFSATYVQAEHTAVGTRLAAIEAALQSVTRGQKAIKDGLFTHGLFGA